MFILPFLTEVIHPDYLKTENTAFKWLVEGMILTGLCCGVSSAISSVLSVRQFSKTGHTLQCVYKRECYGQYFAMVLRD